VSGITVAPALSAESAKGPMPASLTMMPSSKPPSPSSKGSVTGIWPPEIETCGPESP
jgi:hypothetical protein